MLEQLDRLENEAQVALKDVGDQDALAEWRSAYLGRKGKVTGAVKAIGTLPPEERPAYGQQANQVKKVLEAAYEAKIEALKRAARAGSRLADAVDVGLPGRAP